MLKIGISKKQLDSEHYDKCFSPSQITDEVIIQLSAIHEQLEFSQLLSWTDSSQITGCLKRESFVLKVK